MRQVVIIGTGDFAKLMSYYVLEYGDSEVVAFSVNKQYIHEENTNLQGLPVVPLETLAMTYNPSKYDVLIAVGYSRMNDVRKKLFTECKHMGYTVSSFIHPSATIAKNVTLGEGNIILEKCLIQPFATVGDGNLIWNDVKISHDDTIESFNTITGNASLCGFVKIGNHCFVGNSCVVCEHLRVADYTLIGAGAIVKKDTKPYDVIVPARSVTLSERKSTDYI